MTRADCRSRLMEVATELFARKGFYGVSIRELAQAAGASISMISYHFGGKEGLYAAVLQEQFACFDQLDDIRGQAGGPLAVMTAYLRWTIQRHRNNPQLLRFYTSELTNPTPCFAAIVSPAIASVIRLLAESIEAGMARGLFRQDLHAVNSALALAGMVNYFFLSTLATEELTSHSPDQDEELIRQYVAIFTRGIMADGGAAPA